MEREFRFRAWHNETEQMLFVGDSFGTNHPLDCVNYARQGQDVVLMQYVGLKDKNGKEIYEGDIVRFLDGECTSTESGMDCDEFENVGEIVWEGYHWDVTNRNGIDTEEAFSDEFEVIGNIYENPELINKATS